MLSILLSICIHARSESKSRFSVFTQTKAEEWVQILKVYVHARSLHQGSTTVKSSSLLLFTPHLMGTLCDSSCYAFYCHTLPYIPVGLLHAYRYPHSEQLLAALNKISRASPALLL